MVRWLVVAVCVIFAVSRAVAQNDTIKNATFAEFKYAKFFRNTNATTAAENEVLRQQAIMKNCSHQYSITCLKIDIGKLVDRLVTTRSIQLLPGVSLVNTENVTLNRTDFPVGNNELNSYLLHKIGKYVGSLLVRVNLLDNPIVHNLKDMTYTTFNDVFYPVEQSGRSKKTGKQDTHAAMWSAAMLAALGFSGLAALAGKAMLTAALALVLALVCLLKGCGGGHRAAHYEIITKPVPGHLHDIEHLGLSAASLGSNQFGGYARHLIQDRAVIPSLSILDANDSSDEKEYVREVIPIHAYQMSPNYSPSSMIHR